MLDNGGVMTTKVKEIAEQVKALRDDEREEFLSWLADFEIEHSDDWDAEIARDSQPGGRLERVLGRVRKDIAEGRTNPHYS
jgi:ferritin